MKLDLLWEKESSKAEEIPQEVIELANKRLQAKQSKDYSLADQLRNEIQQMWFSIKDTPWWFEIEKI